MTRRTAVEIGMPERVAPEVALLVQRITGRLTTDDKAMEAITVLLSNFTVESLVLIDSMATTYDAAHLLLLSQSLRHESSRLLVHTIPKREARAIHLTAVVPVAFAFEEGGYSAPERGWFNTVPMDEHRRIKMEVHIDHSMDGMIKTGRESHKVQGIDWVPFSRGIMVYQTLEQYRICGGSPEELEYIMMLGRNMDRVVSMSQTLLDLRGRFGKWNGLTKEQVRHLVEGGSPALIDGCLL